MSDTFEEFPNPFAPADEHTDDQPSFVYLEDSMPGLDYKNTYRVNDTPLEKGEPYVVSNKPISNLLSKEEVTVRIFNGFLPDTGVPKDTLHDVWKYWYPIQKDIVPFTPELMVKHLESRIFKVSVDPLEKMELYTIGAIVEKGVLLYEGNYKDESTPYVFVTYADLKDHYIFALSRKPVAHVKYHAAWADKIKEAKNAVPA